MKKNCFWKEKGKSGEEKRLARGQLNAAPHLL